MLSSLSQCLSAQQKIFITITMFILIPQLAYSYDNVCDCVNDIGSLDLMSEGYTIGTDGKLKA